MIRDVLPIKHRAIDPADKGTTVDDQPQSEEGLQISEHDEEDEDRRSSISMEMIRQSTLNPPFADLIVRDRAEANIQRNLLEMGWPSTSD